MIERIPPHNTEAEKSVFQNFGSGGLCCHSAADGEADRAMVCETFAFYDPLSDRRI